MREIWLKPNARALLLGLLPPCAIEAIGLAVAVIGWVVYPSHLLSSCGVILAIVAQLVLVSIVLQLNQPRIAYQAGGLLLYVRTGAPVRVPIEIVEGFLLGQGPTMLSGQGHDWETSTLVIKLSDNAQEWQKVEVKPAIASWCNSYVTIRGTWCERLNVEVVNRLNLRLTEVRSKRGAQSTT